MRARPTIRDQETYYSSRSWKAQLVAGLGDVDGVAGVEGTLEEQDGELVAQVAPAEPGPGPQAAEYVPSARIAHRCQGARTPIKFI
jgi:hypothetical protein